MSDHTTESSPIEEVAKVAYEGYFKKTGGKSIFGDDILPRWPDLPKQVQDAWLASARAVLDFLIAKTENGE